MGQERLINITTEISDNFWQKQKLTKYKLDIVQINLGNLCNQACTHCHIEASPKGMNNLQDSTAQNILKKLIELPLENVEFTGGAPEMNPNLEMFITELSKHKKKITVRTNLTILEKSEYQHFIDLYKTHNVKLIASLPALFADATDRQRGRGVFDASIRVLQKLNEIGYGTNGLKLDFVYNPTGEYLPPPQYELENDYKRILREKHDISFNNLATIVNTPITRYRDYLTRNNKYDEYLDLLKRNYNSATLEKIMCRNLIVVDYQGYIYDCDFNFAADMRVKGYETVKFWEIDFDEFAPEIAFADHCYACTVNNGSSCHGVLLAEKPIKELESDVDDYTTEIQDDVRESVKQYYSEDLQHSGDLKTSACCTIDSIPDYVKETLPLIHEEITTKYYGCGTAFPNGIEGLKILDLGCGTGRDAYIMSKLVGQNGFVYGIDMTESQIEIAKKYQTDQMARFGYKDMNVEFIHDYMENADKYIQPNSLDMVTSNCVINLAEDKEKIFKKIFKLLKNGGELYFSDVYSDRRLPKSLRQNHVLYGECLGGALYTKDFERIAKRVGFADQRVVKTSKIEIEDKKIAELVGNAKFYSITYRLWKIDGMEDACEDYGHVAVYRGGLPGSMDKYELDEEHVFEKHRPERICGNTALMLSATRLRKYFDIVGSFDQHFGLFEVCGSMAFNSEKEDKNNDKNFCGC
jgi:arsenite methyltransferase